MKFAVFLLVFSAAYAATLYPTGTTVNLKCDLATFDQTGVAVSGSPTNVSVCSSNCQSDHLDYGAKLNETTGQVVGLAADKYTGCSFPTDYSIPNVKTTAPCLYTSTKGIRGFFTAIDSHVMVTKENIVEARLWVKVATADPAATPWQIYKATSDVDSCNDYPGSMNDAWITGSAVPASVEGSLEGYIEVNLINVYRSNDAENSKMYIFAVPGGNTTVDDTSDRNIVATLSNGPMQVGVSTECGSITDCNTCVSESCTWCQLTAGHVTSGVCGITLGQCYGQQYSYGSVGWYLDQCTIPEATTSTRTRRRRRTTSTSTTRPRRTRTRTRTRRTRSRRTASTATTTTTTATTTKARTTTTTKATTATTAASTTTSSGASATMMLSVLGAVLLSAALAL